MSTFECRSPWNCNFQWDCYKAPGLYSANLNGVELPMNSEEAEALGLYDINNDCLLDEKDFDGNGMELTTAYVDVKKTYSPEQWETFSAENLFVFAKLIDNTNSYFRKLNGLCRIKGFSSSPGLLGIEVRKAYPPDNFSINLYYSAPTWSHEVIPTIGEGGSEIMGAKLAMCNSFEQFSALNNDGYSSSPQGLAAMVPPELTSAPFTDLYVPIFPFVIDYLDESGNYQPTHRSESIKYNLCCVDARPEEDWCLVDNRCVADHMCPEVDSISFELFCESN